MRDRIIELIRVPAEQLAPNGRNWRLHPPAQMAAMRDALNRIGYAGAVLARRREDGQLELIDGHLRAELSAGEQVPVLVLDVDETEAATLLATFDPISNLADRDEQMLQTLLAEIAEQDQQLGELARGIHAEADPQCIEMPDIQITPLYQVFVECRDERQQREVYELLTQHGHVCRLTVL